MIHTDLESRDIGIVKHQLGGREVFMDGVVKRCYYGMPSVILLAPVNFTAVATLLWLSCPFLNKRIHALESDGFIKKIEKIIREDDSLTQEMQKAHNHYIALRKSCCENFFAQNTDSSGLQKLSESGIGGIRDTGNLKCLHLAAAHYAVCADNTAGRAVFELLGEEQYCANGMCRLSESI